MWGTATVTNVQGEKHQMELDTNKHRHVADKHGPSQVRYVEHTHERTRTLLNIACYSMNAKCDKDTEEKRHCVPGTLNFVSIYCDIDLKTFEVRLCGTQTPPNIQYGGICG